MAIIGDIVDLMTGIILQGYVNTAGKADHEDAKIAVSAFLNKNIRRLLAWADAHPGRRPPVYFNSDTGSVLWLDRKQHRKYQRAEAKARALASSRSSARTQKSSRLEKNLPHQNPLKEAADD